ncbi:YoaK family protein [Yaniella halotolerans]|uniref:YoaK family protein n=1 Tax=Yaniella halotolerans TaxID=225453 RepID=UPI0003B4D171|nr:YoaK family protein [Yaniella halotolerans]
MAASLSTRQHLLAVGLTANAGFVDGLFFIHLGGYFVSFMSGNSTRAAAELSQGNHLAWLAASSLIVAFIVGVMLASFAVRFGPKRFHPPAESLLTDQVTPHGSAVWVAYALMLLGGITAVTPPLDIAASFIVAAATGAINGTFTRRGEVTVGLTYMTGTLVKMGQALASAMALQSSVYLFRFLRYLVLWGAIAVGSLIGGWSYLQFGIAAIWLTVAAMTVLSIALTWRVRRRNA